MLHRRIDTQREDVDFKGRTISIHVLPHQEGNALKDNSVGQTFAEWLVLSAMMGTLSASCMI